MISYFTGKPADDEFDSPHHKGAMGEFTRWFTEEMEMEYQSIDCSGIVGTNPVKKVQYCPSIIASTYEKCMEILDLSQPTPSPDLIRKFVAQIVPEGKTNFQWHLNLDGNQTTHVGMTVEGRKNKAVVSFAAEGTCSPLAFGAIIEYPTLCHAALDKNADLSAMQDRLPSKNLSN